MAERRPDELADPGLDGRQDLVRGRVGRGPVADHRARVAHEVGQRHDPALAQHLGPRLGVRGVGSGGDHPDTRRQRPGGLRVDHSRPGPGDQHIGAHLGKELVRWHDRPAVAQDARVAMYLAQREQPADVETRGVRDAPGHGRHRGHPAAAPGDLARHPAADLAETLDGDRTAGQASAQGRLGGHRDAVPGQQVLERHARHHGADRRGCGPALAQRREVLLGRAHVRPGQEPARLGQRPDLRTEPGHQGGLARGVRRIPAHARLGAADPLAQRGELVGHRACQHRHLGHADVRRQPRSPGRQRRPGQVEHHESRYRAELDNLCTAIATRHVPIMTRSRPTTMS